MRVFSQINNCQQKNHTNKQNKKGAPLLGLAKSISYISYILNSMQKFDVYLTEDFCSLCFSIVRIELKMTFFPRKTEK